MSTKAPPESPTDDLRSSRATGRIPRHERPRYQRLPLPPWVRVLVLTAGWLLVLLGIAGIFLPVLQGGLSLAIGFALISLGSPRFHLGLRRLMGRWPRIWKRMERFRRRVHTWLHRRTHRTPPPADNDDDRAA